MIARIVYSRSHTLGGLAIRHREDGAKRRWSHSGVLLGTDTTDSVVWEARAFHRFGPSTWNEFISRGSRYEIVQYTVEDLRPGIEWLESMRGTNYPLLTILGLAVGIHYDHPGQVHCQEATETFLCKCGVTPRWRDGFHMVVPNSGYNNQAGVLR
jgi:hypothetical protein